MIIFFDDWIPLLFLLCSSSKGAWFHDKSRDATPGDIKSFEVRSAFFFSLNQVHHYLQYLADDGHDAMLVSAIAIIPFHAPLDRAPVELWSVNAYCRQLAFWSHQLVQFFFFWTEEFSPHFYAQCAQKYCGPPSLNPWRQCWPLAQATDQSSLWLVPHQLVQLSHHFQSFNLPL
jgi:hypothetical protein